MSNALTSINFTNRLGAGAFGEVWRAQVAPHGLVAVKRVDCIKMGSMLSVTDWTTLVPHVRAEADKLRKAEHPHVVRVHSVHDDASNAHEILIVTELCDGSLEALAKAGPLPLSDVKRYARDALAGLEALHLRGMVHRDIKPGNILVVGDSAKLADFGLVEDNLVAGYASQQGYLDHVAPEYFISQKMSAKTDIWAMGLTLFRLLNGEPWYREVQGRWGIDWSDPSAARQAIEALVTARTFAARLPWLPHIPDAWRRVVRQAVHHDPARRFGNGGQMLTAVAKLPGSPSWTCSWSSTSVEWTRPYGGREEVVVWTRGSTHDFIAFTRDPSGNAGRYTLDSGGGLSEKAVMRALQAFFETRNP